jgi:hypothetical protein
MEGRKEGNSRLMGIKEGRMEWGKAILEWILETRCSSNTLKLKIRWGSEYICEN